MQQRRLSFVVFVSVLFVYASLFKIGENFVTLALFESKRFENYYLANFFPMRKSKLKFAYVKCFNCSIM